MDQIKQRCSRKYLYAVQHWVVLWVTVLGIVL